MNSKKFPFYYLLFALFTLGLLFSSYYLLKDTPAVNGSWFGPASIPLFILFNPIYYVWIFFSFIFWIISGLFKTEKAIRFLNYFLIFLPVIIYVTFELLILILNR